MRTAIVKIGNSRGLRIPKPLLGQCGLAGEVDLVVRGRELVIRKVRRPRAGWDKAFEAMARLGDDRPPDKGAGAPTEWDKADWEWK